MKRYSRKIYRGITLIELMIGISVAAIILTMAGTFMRDASARTEIQASTAELTLALRSAKHAARYRKTSVRCEIKLADDNSSYVIHFTAVDRRDSDNNANLANIGLGLADIELPDNILITSDRMIYTFDSHGLVDSAGTISLLSTIDSDYESTVTINNTTGYVTSSFSTASEEGAS